MEQLTLPGMVFQTLCENEPPFKTGFDALLHAASDQAKQSGTKPIEELQLEIENYIDGSVPTKVQTATQRF